MHDVSELLHHADARASRDVYLLTPEEIREACLAIQAEWSPDEELSRRVVKGGATWHVPEVGKIRTDGPGE